MPLNVINKSMITKNTVELKPTVNYVSASSDCNNLHLHNLTTAGITGEEKARVFKPNDFEFERNNITFDSPRVFKINEDKFASNSDTNTKILNNIKDFMAGNNAVSLSAYLTLLSYRGIEQNNSYDYKFGVEKIKQKFLIDDENYYKKKSIKNLYEFYRENIEFRNISPSWGIKNYSTINFFNVNNSLNSTFAAGKTHKNFIAYPNLFYNNKQTYDFSDSNKTGLTFSFYLNQRRKNETGYHFNPGCILHIPHMIGIYVVKGSNVDVNGYTDKYRLYIELGDVTNNTFDSDGVLRNNIGSTSSFISSGNIISSDDLLSYNNWHNVAIQLQYKSDNVYDLIINVDGTKKDEFLNVPLNPSNSASKNNIIFIGNRPQNLSNNLENYFKKLFSTSFSVNEDTLGPYVKKNIDFGNRGDDYTLVTTVPDSGFNSNFNNVTTGATKVYTESNTSLALNAEIHDIRIYNTFISDTKDLICENNITDFTDSNLLFSVPVYYYDTPVKKRSIVNLKGLNDSNNNINNIDTNNLYIEGLINPYFVNKCLGHEVSIENFLYEFKNKVSPNIVFNETYEDDSAIINSYNIIAHNSDFDNVNDSVNLKVASGECLSQIYFDKIKSENLTTVSLQDYYYLSNIYYRNNFILPNDNGIQNQNYINFNGYYINNLYNGKFHYDDNKDLDISFISVNNTFTSKIEYKPLFSIESNLSSASLYNFNSNYDSLKPLNDRDNFYIDANKTKAFKESYDIFKNSSLNNYYNGLFKLSDNYDDQRAITNNTEQFVNKFTVGRNRFFNDYSNPASRKITDSYTNAVGNTLASIAEKEIDNNITPDTIGYFKHELPLFKLSNDTSESYSTVFSVSTQLFRREIEKESVEINDFDLAGSGGALQISLKDNGLGGLYRADCLTKQAKWNSVGHCLYKEGMLSVLHPGLENFGRNNVSIKFKCATQLNVFELNLPAHAGQTNLSRNTSYDKDLRLDDSAFNSDESFVYITDINLHDQDLNIIAKAKLAKPFAKKSLDNVVFRIKMDY